MGRLKFHAFVVFFTALTQQKHRTFTRQKPTLLHNRSIEYRAAKLSFFAVLQPCFLHNKKPEVWEVNFTAIERKITQQKYDVLVFLKLLISIYNICKIQDFRF
jgi:hypothetical protein